MSDIAALLQIGGNETCRLWPFLVYMSATIYTLLAVIGLIPAFHFALAGSQVSLVLLLLFLQQGLYQRMRATEALHREAELRMVAAEKQALAEVQRRHAQSTFLNLVAHELKTPLAVIDSAIQVLEIQPGKPDDLAVSRYEIIRRAVSHLNGLLENTLSVERRDNAPLQPRIELIAPAPFVAAIVRQVIPPGRHCDIHLQDDTLCAADRMLLKLALSNLLVNAVKYSPHDSHILLDISKAVVEERERTLILVSNLYAALEKPDCRIWFDKYYRQHELPNVEGLGLGLYLVREIARCHGGEVSCLIEPQPSLWRVTLSLWLPDMLERKA